MTDDQFKKLPDVFQEIVLLDDLLLEPVVSIGWLARRKHATRLAQIFVHQPGPSTSKAAAAR